MPTLLLAVHRLFGLPPRLAWVDVCSHGFLAPFPSLTDNQSRTPPAKVVLDLAAILLLQPRYNLVFSNCTKGAANQSP